MGALRIGGGLWIVYPQRNLHWLIKKHIQVLIGEPLMLYLSLSELQDSIEKKKKVQYSFNGYDVKKKLVPASKKKYTISPYYIVVYLLCSVQRGQKQDSLFQLVNLLIGEFLAVVEIGNCGVAAFPLFGLRGKLVVVNAHLFPGQRVVLPVAVERRCQVLNQLVPGLFVVQSIYQPFAIDRESLYLSLSELQDSIEKKKKVLDKI